MDLRLLSKDHAVTVAVCDDTLTEIRYTTLKDTTRIPAANQYLWPCDCGASHSLGSATCAPDPKPRMPSPSVFWNTAHVTC